MSTGAFQFKQFKIEQHNTAMKVSTDACIFGAWVAKLWKEKSGQVLDIGTGTGLLSLMLLQEGGGIQITTLEPELFAAREAASNFEKSNWGNRTDTIQKKLQDFWMEQSNKKFDLIICNPPFFQNHLLGEKESRNQARHDSLVPEELAYFSRKMITNQGQLAVIYPKNIWDKWLQASNAEGWKVKYILNIKPSAQKEVNRICGIFEINSEQAAFSTQTLVIRKEQNVYTKDFIALLKPFYLYL